MSLLLRVTDNGGVQAWNDMWWMCLAVVIEYVCTATVAFFCNEEWRNYERQAFHAGDFVVQSTSVFYKGLRVSFVPC